MDLARVIPWQQVAPPDEASLLQQLVAEGLEPYRWSNEPFASYARHRHSYLKILVVLRGSITFTLDSGRALAMRAGDRLELPPRTNHSALVGPVGVVCLEAPRI
jgi:quercetin dioxygenase-like cupin family protein